MIWIILALILSLALNGLLLWYIRQTLRRLLFASENFAWLMDSIKNFSEHLQNLHELEMFYGDATLEHLMEHATSFNKQLETFEYIYSLTEEGEAPINDDEEKPEDEAEEA